MCGIFLSPTYNTSSDVIRIFCTDHLFMCLCFLVCSCKFYVTIFCALKDNHARYMICEITILYIIINT